MDALVRMVGSVTALGAALIALAVGAAPSALTAAPWLAVPLLACAVGQAVVAVLLLRWPGSWARRDARAPRDARGPFATLLLLAPTLVWLAGLAAAPDAAATVPLGPMLAHSALALGAAALLARRGGAQASQEPRPLTALLSLAATAAVVATVATTALAGTEAGLHAVPHGEHGGVTDTTLGEAPVLEEHGHH